MSFSRWVSIKDMQQTKQGRWILRILLFVLLIGLATSVQLLTTPKSKAPHLIKESSDSKHATLVTTATAKAATVPVYLSALGTVTPFYTVTVKTKINGQLQKVLFTEGQMVKEGDLLAQIDSRPYEAQLMQFQGQLERDKALLENAKNDLIRDQALYKKKFVSKQMLDTQKALVKQYEGTLKSDEGQIAAIKVNLLYCQVVAPFTGQVGLRLVDPGNYVQTSDAAGLVVLNQVTPVTVVFTIPEDSVPLVVKKVQQGEKLEVDAYDRTQVNLLDKGELMTMDNQIDITTGTIKLKALFENKKTTLFPNQFVNIQLLVNTLKEAILVPTSAVQFGAKGAFVYVVGEGQKARLQYVTVGVTHQDDTVIKEGIKIGDVIIKEGTDKLTNGAEIKIASPPENKVLLDTEKKTTT